MFRSLVKFSAFAFLGLATTALPASAQSDSTMTVRIGLQRSSTLTAILRANGELEKALTPLKVRVSWQEFTSGLPLLEALNLGNVDVSADVADTVPVLRRLPARSRPFRGRVGIAIGTSHCVSRQLTDQIGVKPEEQEDRRDQGRGQSLPWAAGGFAECGRELQGYFAGLPHRLLAAARLLLATTSTPGWRRTPSSPLRKSSRAPAFSPMDPT